MICLSIEPFAGLKVKFQTRKKAPTEVRAFLRYMKKKGGENPCLVTGCY